jgi:hypothetical protein
MQHLSKTIKSKERVRDLAEVFTSEREVNAMLDLGMIKYLSENIENTLLEPSCGNGNFLVAILKRKLDTIKAKYKKQEDIEFYIIKAVASIYGIDISEENVLEARQRMYIEVNNFYSNKFNTRKPNEGFWDSLNDVLEKNIIIGDVLNKFHEIILVEYTTPRTYYFKRQEFRLDEQVRKKKGNEGLFETEVPLKSYKISNYLKLC